MLFLPTLVGYLREGQTHPRPPPAEPILKGATQVASLITAMTVAVAIAVKVLVAVAAASSTKTITTHYFARLSVAELKRGTAINISAGAVTSR